MDQELIAGIGLGIASFIFFGWIFFVVTVRNNPLTTTLILRFGKVIETIKTPGLQFRWGLVIPGTTSFSVSHALEGFRIEDIHVNDRDGTTMRIDLWVECRITDAVKASFGIESWRESLQSVIKHAIMAVAGTHQFEHIISNRTELLSDVRSALDTHIKEWGIELETLNIQDIRILPEVTSQLFDRVAAQIEMEKARLEEEGRIAIHVLEADTELKISELRAEARSHSSLAIGRAYADLRKTPKLMNAFETLHRYSKIQPSKTTAFFGFEGEELSVLDAAMLPETKEKKSAMKGSDAELS